MEIKNPFTLIVFGRMNGFLYHLLANKLAALSTFHIEEILRSTVAFST
jgi:hypothetical protein